MYTVYIHFGQSDSYEVWALACPYSAIQSSVYSSRYLPNTFEGNEDKIRCHQVKVFVRLNRARRRAKMAANGTRGPFLPKFLPW